VNTPVLPTNRLSQRKATLGCAVGVALPRDQIGLVMALAELQIAQRAIVNALDTWLEPPITAALHIRQHHDGLLHMEERRA